MADSPSARRSNTTDSTDGEMMSALAAELLDDSNILGLREYLELFEEIAEPTRFAMCYTLQTDGTMSASELGDTLNRTENGLHYHLDRLQDAGLVENRKRSKPNADGLYSYYELTGLGADLTNAAIDFIQQEKRALDEY